MPLDSESVTSKASSMGDSTAPSLTSSETPEDWFLSNMNLVTRKPDFAYAKTKALISFAVTAKLISAFVFATQIVQFLFFQNPKFQASSFFLLLYRPVYVKPGRKPKRPFFSHCISFVSCYKFRSDDDNVTNMRMCEL